MFCEASILSHLAVHVSRSTSFVRKYTERFSFTRWNESSSNLGLSINCIFFTSFHGSINPHPLSLLSNDRKKKPKTLLRPPVQSCDPVFSLASLLPLPPSETVKNQALLMSF